MTPFIRDLFAEVRKWTAQGIISPEQQSKIEALYLPVDAKPARPEPAVRTEKGLNITGVIIGLASLCLAVGIIIFYAANWKKMPPSIKLIQVFFLVIGSYTAAGYFLFSETRSKLIGRGLLFIGMCTFGAGIMLVAQIYHISAHPTNGIFAWAVGVFAIAAIMKDKFGMYLSSLLFFIWYSWEYSEFHNPAYMYLLIIATGCAVYILLKDKIGIVFSFLLALCFFYMTVAHHMFGLENLILFNFSLLNLPLAGFLYCAGLYLKKFDTAVPTAVLMKIFGMILFITVFASISWPFSVEGAGVMYALRDHAFKFPFLYIGLLLGTGAALYLLYRDKKEILFPLSIASFPFIAAFLPMGHNITRMVSMHCAVAAIFFVLLFFSFTEKEKNVINTAFAFTFAFAMIIAKCIGFFSFAMFDDYYRVSYLSGFIIFAVVCLLINALTAHLVRKRGIEYPSGILHALCAVTVWLIIYAASFKMPDQKSALHAHTVVVVMLALFSGIAAVLIALLSKIIKEKKIVIINAAALFLLALASIIATDFNPDWITFSLIFNAMLIIVTIVYIHYSAVTRSKAVLNLAVIAFAVIIFTRYFDLFWDMLSGSVLFISTGILGLAGGYFLERKRRRLSKQIEESGPLGAGRGGNSHE